MSQSLSPGPKVVSVVVPIYNEEGNVSVFVQRLAGVFQGLGVDWELVFALDPCFDGTREKVLEMIRSGYPIRLITFSRRIGKPLSLLAGLDHALGDVCVVMDADLQDPPELIGEMLEKWREGFKVVLAQRKSRKGENFLYLKAAQLFYRIHDCFSEVKIPKNTGDFRLLDARVVKALRNIRERHGFLRGMTASVGFSTAVVPFDRDPRFKGRTQIPFSGAVNIALDGLVPFSRTPVRMIFVFGAAVSVLTAVGFAIWLLWGCGWGFHEQWPLVLLGFCSLALSGITLTGLGIIGEYLVRAYEEARVRPLYVVDEIAEADSLVRKLAHNPDERERHRQ